MRRILGAAALFTAISLTAGCEDDPFALRWQNLPDTATVYSLAREELYLPSGYNFYTRSPVQVEVPAGVLRWDFALDTDGDRLIMRPPGDFGVSSTAAIVPLGDVPWETVEEAPRDSAAYISDRPVPVVLDHIYVIRTHTEVGGFGGNCVYYSRMRPLVVDVDQGVMDFLLDPNPICNDRTLIAPED